MHRNTIFNDKNLWGNQIEYCSLRMESEKLILYVCEESEEQHRKKKKRKRRKNPRTHIQMEEIYVAVLLPSKAIEEKSNK